MLDSHVQHTADQFVYVQVQITALSSQIDDLFIDRGSDSESDQFQPFGHFGQKGGENFEGELAQIGGAQLRAQKHWFHSGGGLLFILTFITAGYCFYSLSTLFLISILYSICLCLSQCFVAFFCTFKILLLCLKYFTLVPQQDLVPRCKYFVYFELVVCWTCNCSLWLVFIALHVRMSILLDKYSLWSFFND